MHCKQTGIFSMQGSKQGIAKINRCQVIRNALVPLIVIFCHGVDSA
jgi:hypothetical protein